MLLWFGRLQTQAKQLQIECRFQHLLLHHCCSSIRMAPHAGTPTKKKKHTRLRKVIETAETHGFLIFSSVSEETLRRERPSSRLQRLEISVNDHRSLCKNSLHPQQRTPMEDHSLDHFNNRSNNQHILGYYYGLGPLPTQLEEQMVERQATYPTQIRLLHSHCKNTLP